MTEGRRREKIIIGGLSGFKGKPAAGSVVVSREVYERPLQRTKKRMGNYLLRTGPPNRLVLKSH